MFIIIKNNGYAILQMFVVAFDFKTLSKRGIPPINTIFKACNTKAIKTRITNVFSDIKLISFVLSTLILFLTIKNPPEKIIHAKIMIKNTLMLRGSSNL